MPSNQGVHVDRTILEELTFRKARESFAAFTNVIDLPDGPVRDDEVRDPREVLKRPFSRHHELMIDSFEAVERGEIRRLMLFMPPGVGKSIYSKAFLAWYAGRNPRKQVVGIAYNTEVASEQIGKGCRYMVGQPAYQRMFGCGLDPNDASTSNFALTNLSKFKIRGFGGGITSIRADLILIDDPIKNFQEAQSQTVRDGVRKEYQASVLTRGRPNYSIILVQTRWHEDDLAGGLLPEGYNGESGDIMCRDGNEWRVLCFPAEAEREDDPLGRKPGEMIWPEYYPAEHWDTHRKNNMIWNALFQQRPTPEDGTFFKKEWFDGTPDGIKPSTRYNWSENFWKASPMALYMTSDHANSTNGDWSVFSIWGVGANQNLYLIDQYRSKGYVNDTFGWMVDENGKIAIKGQGALALIQKYKPRAWFPEQDPTWINNEGQIKNAMMKCKVFCPMYPQRVSGKGSKAERAMPYQSMSQLGLVHLPRGLKDGRGMDVGDEAISEYLKFTPESDKGHDDQVDAHALIARMITEAHEAIYDVDREEPKPTDSYKEVRVSGDDDDFYSDEKKMDMYF